MIELRFGGPMWQLCYDRERLSDSDRNRSLLVRASRAERDWQVSRAVAAALRAEAGCRPNTPVALSHSHGHALVGLAPAGRALGVDLERCHPRDVDALAQWVCTAGEQAFLKSLADSVVRLKQFYVLWTLKESLLKAAGLAFPAGMRQVGLEQPGTPMEALRGLEGTWQAMVWQLPDDWIAAAAWQADADTAGSGTVLWRQPQQPYLLGCWHTPEAGAMARHL